MPDALQLEVVTPEREVVRESVAEVQLPGRNGYLGILPGHTPLLSELGVGALSYQKGAQTIYVAVLGGLAEVLPDRVTVLADDAERPEDIDVPKTRTELAAAEKKLTGGGSDPSTDWDAVLREVAEARVRLEVAGHGGAGTSSGETHS